MTIFFPDRATSHGILPGRSLNGNSTCRPAIPCSRNSNDSPVRASVRNCRFTCWPMPCSAWVFAKWRFPRFAVRRRSRACSLLMHDTVHWRECYFNNSISQVTSRPQLNSRRKPSPISCSNTRLTRLYRDLRIVARVTPCLHLAVRSWPSIQNKPVVEKPETNSTAPIGVYFMVSLTMPASNPASTHLATHPVRILVADDHEVMRLGLRNLLEAVPGWSVYAEARTGAEAVELALVSSPDIIIMDITMPEMNGLEATAKIAVERPEIPVILFSLHLSEDVITRFKTGSIRGAVAKSEAARDLLDAVRSVLNGGTFFPSKSSSAAGN